MSDEREKALGELRQQAGAIDPLATRAADYGRGMKAVQSLARAQGEVMSLALDNNHNLYHANKELKRELEIAQQYRHNAESDLSKAQRKLEAATEYAKKLEAAGGDKYKPLYEQARQTLANYLHDQLGPDELAAKLKAMKDQAAAIAADPQALTPAQIDEMKRDTGFDDPPPQPL